MPIKSPDITAALMLLPERLVLVVSVYIYGVDFEELREACDNVRKVITDSRRDAGGTVDVVIAGDFY